MHNRRHGRISPCTFPVQGTCLIHEHQDAQQIALSDLGIIRTQTRAQIFREQMGTKKNPRPHYQLSWAVLNGSLKLQKETCEYGYLIRALSGNTGD